MPATSPAPSAREEGEACCCGVEGAAGGVGGAAWLGTFGAGQLSMEDASVQFALDRPYRLRSCKHCVDRKQ